MTDPIPRECPEHVQQRYEDSERLQANIHGAITDLWTWEVRVNPEIWNGLDGNDYIVAISGDTSQQAGGEDVSAPRDQQVESTETETSRTRETARLHNLGLKAALCVAFFSFVSVGILFAVFSIPSSTFIHWNGHAPTVDMVVFWTSEGYELEVAAPSRMEALSAYKVTVLKDGIPWGTPSVVKQGDCGNGPVNEELNFTDLTADGKLTGGDFFTLENLTSGSQYEVILLWAADDTKITSETMYVP